MLSTLQVGTLVLVALAMVPALAHALELPGKKRLPKETYLAVQTIYYPGFTIIGGVGEFVGMLATLALLFVVPRDTAVFWLTMVAFIALVLMHGIFWVFTQPVNRVWLRDQKLNRAAESFFRTGTLQGDWPNVDWRELRDQWEYSHLARAVVALTAFVLLASALATTS